MANIRADVSFTIQDGSEIVFRSPCDCSEVTGLRVYYPAENGIVSKDFALADAHANNVGDINHLFAEDVVVKVILDVTNSMAYVQNADTNAYLEERFKILDTVKAPITRTINGQSLMDDINLGAADVGARPSTWTPTHRDVGTAALKTLWVNPSPGAPFGTLGIAMDLSGYDCVEVVCSIGELPNTFIGSAKVPIGQSGIVCGFGPDFWMHTRQFEVSSSGVTFGLGNMRSPEGEIVANWDNRCVPYKIYGIREVH